MIKHSKQRDCIQSFLRNRKDHPTAETVYLGIRDELPKISLATVYRNLSLLADMGEIQKISTGNGPDRFDPDTSSHNHFLCEECGSVIDLEMESTEYIDEMAKKNFAGVIRGHSLYFRGICPDCCKKHSS